MSYLYSLIEILYVILAAPFIIGVQHALEERMESKQGPSVFQPYYDIIKLFKKESLVQKISPPIFRLGIYAVFMFYASLCLFIPDRSNQLWEIV